MVKLWKVIPVESKLYEKGGAGHMTMTLSPQRRSPHLPSRSVTSRPRYNQSERVADRPEAIGIHFAHFFI